MEERRSFTKRVTHHARQHWLTVAFILGFIGDNLTLNRVDQLFDNIVLLTYVVLAMLSIIGLYSGIAGRYGEKTNTFLKRWSPILMQYAFGGLLSGMLIFYGRSGSFVESWPFILIILGVIYGNETISSRHSRLIYNFVIFFVGLLSYVVLVTSVILGKMGPVVFVGSGILALGIMFTFFRVVERIIPNFIALHKRNTIFIIGLIYIVFNALYFANVIPPIPLSMKHVGIYHDVVHPEGSPTYTLTYEKPSWWEWYRNSDSTFHYTKGESVFCFASVFAPSRLTTKIYHRWAYYDEEKRDWVEHARIPYSIEGGRGDGYRGYTKVQSYREGKWKCSVETERGQVIGSETFTIASGVRKELVTREE